VLNQFDSVDIFEQLGSFAGNRNVTSGSEADLAVGELNDDSILAVVVEVVDCQSILRLNYQCN